MLGHRPFRRRRPRAPGSADWVPCLPGDIIEVPGDGKAWRVVSCVPDLAYAHPSGSGWRSEIPATWAWRLRIERPDGSSPSETVLDPVHARWVYTCGVIDDDDGHFQVCSICGDVWPCWHVRFARDSDRQIALLEERQAYEALHPHECGWCKRIGRRVNRFKTARGLNGHLRRCESNPAVWNLASWVPVITDNLHNGGGYDPTCGPSELNAMTALTGVAASDEHARRARRVIAAAAAVAFDPERLPATIDDCPDVP